jgi:hypothetical protein
VEETKETVKGEAALNEDALKQGRLKHVLLGQVQLERRQL